MPNLRLNQTAVSLPISADGKAPVSTAIIHLQATWKDNEE